MAYIRTFSSDEISELQNLDYLFDLIDQGEIAFNNAFYDFVSVYEKWEGFVLPIEKENAFSDWFFDLRLLLKHHLKNTWGENDLKILTKHLDIEKYQQWLTDGNIDFAVSRGNPFNTPQPVNPMFNRHEIKKVRGYNYGIYGFGNADYVKKLHANRTLTISDTSESKKSLFLGFLRGIEFLLFGIIFELRIGAKENRRRRCPFCGNNFIFKRRDQEYCSVECREKSKKTRHRISQKREKNSID